jgi:hypothetical protein
MIITDNSSGIAIASSSGLYIVKATHDKYIDSNLDDPFFKAYKAEPVGFKNQSINSISNVN